MPDHRSRSPAAPQQDEGSVPFMNHEGRVVAPVTNGESNRMMGVPPMNRSRQTGNTATGTGTCPAGKTEQAGPPPPGRPRPPPWRPCRRRNKPAAHDGPVPGRSEDRDGAVARPRWPTNDPGPTCDGVRARHCRRTLVTADGPAYAREPGAPPRAPGPARRERRQGWAGVTTPRATRGHAVTSPRTRTARRCGVAPPSGPLPGGTPPPPLRLRPRARGEDERATPPPPAAAVPRGPRLPRPRMARFEPCPFMAKRPTLSAVHTHPAHKSQ
jgi:hypothetical protein